MSVYKELARIQAELKAPKNQYNSFGKYKYRSCEDILSGFKEVAGGCSLVLQDEIVAVADRIYVKATATLSFNGESVSASSFAREPKDKKGMDDSQITGGTSSYARKYALNGLFAIDDSKDADSNEHHQQASNPQKSNHATINNGQINALQKAIVAKGFSVEQACGVFQVQSLAQLPADQFNNIMNAVNSWQPANQG